MIRHIGRYEADGKGTLIGWRGLLLAPRQTANCGLGGVAYRQIDRLFEDDIAAVNLHQKRRLRGRLEIHAQGALFIFQLFYLLCMQGCR